MTELVYKDQYTENNDRQDDKKDIVYQNHSLCRSRNAIHYVSPCASVSLNDILKGNGNPSGLACGRRPDEIADIIKTDFVI